mgnify:CR=1 FL=1
MFVKMGGNMRIFKIFFLILPIFVVQAQELDQDFLSSLPDDVREDVLKRADAKEEETLNQYRPSRYSSKLEQAEELINLKIRLEKDLLELEKRLNSDNDLTIPSELELFGSNFFLTFQTTFMPINEPNPDASYTLDTGDILNIQMVGQQNSIKGFGVAGDGSISIPEIGKISVAGLSLADAAAIIKSKVASTLIGSEVYVSIEQVRDVNILVTGNAKNPGIYTLTGNSNILHALAAAGGVNEFGSYREINLARNNKVIESLDVYDLLIDGIYNLNSRLRSGDVVFVEPRKSIVTIDGAVKRPAKYEIKDDQNLNNIIKYANGMKQTADRENIYLERILDGTLKSIPIKNEYQFSSIKAIDGDVIYIREFPYRKATISGAILKPGTYTMAVGETLDELIIKAGGFTQNAYPFGAIYENLDAKLINEQSNNVLYEEFLDNIIAISQQNIGQNFDLTPIVSLTEEVKNSNPNGRIVVDLIDENSRNLLKVKDGDTLIIPEKNNNVYVYGETSTQGAVMYSANKNLQYFVDKAGGYKTFADTKSIYILHPNGETQRYSNRRNIFESNPKSALEIYPGSIIFVPRKLDNSSTRRLATQAYVSILGNLGVALASLSSINNNN